MQSPDLFSALKPVLAALTDLEVPHYIGGSVASSSLGVVRATADVDVIADLQPQHLRPFVEKLQGQYYFNLQTMAEAVRRQSCFNLIHLATSFKVDVFAAKTRPYDRKVFHRIQYQAMDAENPQERFPRAAAEDVILSKLEWFRLGDEVSEIQWRDVVGLLKAHYHKLDRAYLEDSAREIGVANLLERAWKQVKS